ncbi:flagellar assembly protein FliH [Massilia sp. Leaf139]|uniref:flagellar assembly protein FliH n=1 Tax=Massilia sp. Leaf139 TaxID=1736272 RepID=UPI0006FE6250|nr:flagellar assembly protein FliH [Massilia sp. Leaf139]KQQ91590.1 flagellar assembly protein FliH [Massilia sp. Leaf139]
MKQFRPFHFPPLHQVRAASGTLSGTEAPLQEDWDSALAAGYRQGQQDGFDAGFEAARAEGFARGQAEGLERGLEEGRAQALAHLDQIGKPVDAALKALKKLKSDFKAAQRKEVVDLVGKIARQVIRAELALQPTQLLALVDEALAAMPPARDTVEVLMNPEELKRVTELDPKRAKKWNLLADPSLDAGEIRVKAGDHEVDAGCQGRLAACMEQVRDAVAGTEGDAA